MTYLMVRHHVRDYKIWRLHFDGHAGARKAAGLSDVMVLRSLDDGNMITVIMAVSDVTRAKAFATSEDLKSTMMKAGVDGPPEATFLESA